MSEINPYESPTTCEPQSPVSPEWQVDGAGLLVKNAVILPQVDLENGLTGPGMKGKQRIHLKSDMMSMVRVLLMVVLVVILKSKFPSINLMWVALLIVIFSLVLNRWKLLKRSENSRIIVWEFISAERQATKATRSKIQIAVFAVSVALMFTPAILSPSTKNYASTVIGTLSTAVIFIVATALWAFLTQPKARTLAGPPGWLRISPVHPDALAYLRNVETVQREELVSQPEPRRRLVRTAYYYRYPMAFLMGENWKRPVVAISIAVMKFTRSKRFEIQLYDSTEAEVASVDQLCNALQEAISGWLAEHPGWSFLSGTTLTSPGGFLTTHNAIIVPPDLLHVVHITRAWAEVEQSRGITAYVFTTCLADGSTICTYAQRFLPLPYERVMQFRERGKPSEAFKAHQERCRRYNVHAPASVDECLAGVKNFAAETELLLTKLGYQSEVRESAV